MLPDLYWQYSTQLVILPTQQLLSLPLLQSFGKLLQGAEGFKLEGLFLFPIWLLLTTMTLITGVQSELSAVMDVAQAKLIADCKISVP